MIKFREVIEYIGFLSTYNRCIQNNFIIYTDKTDSGLEHYDNLVNIGLVRQDINPSNNKKCIVLTPKGVNHYRAMKTLEKL